MNIGGKERRKGILRKIGETKPREKTGSKMTEKAGEEKRQNIDKKRKKQN